MGPGSTIISALPWMSLVFGVFGGAGTTWAADDTKHSLTAGGGVSSPSRSTALFENPAGLVFNHHSEVHLVSYSGSDSFDPTFFGSGFFSGNGSLGGGIEFSGLSVQEKGKNVSLNLDWGIAASIAPWNLSLGISGDHSFRRPVNALGPGWGLDAGVLFHAKGSPRVGVTAYQVSEGLDMMGLGFAIDLGSSVTFVGDGAYSLDSETLSAKPGLKFFASGFQFSASYGFKVSGSSGSGFPEDLSLGVGFDAGRNLGLELYYNTFAKYFLGLKILF